MKTTTYSNGQRNTLNSMESSHSDELKVCPRCGDAKPRDDFVRNRSQRDGLGSYCKPCHIQVTAEAAVRLYGGHRNFLLKLRYGISEAEFEKLVRKQGGTCAICRKRGAKHVDHDHDSGEVRAVLCFYCNRGLGKFREDRGLIRRARRYLDSARGTRP